MATSHAHFKQCHLKLSHGMHRKIKQLQPSPAPARKACWQSKLQMRFVLFSLCSESYLVNRNSRSPLPGRPCGPSLWFVSMGPSARNPPVRQVPHLSFPPGDSVTQAFPACWCRCWCGQVCLQVKTCRAPTAALVTEEKVPCDMLEPMLHKQEATVQQVPSSIAKQVVEPENATGKGLAARLS